MCMESERGREGEGGTERGKERKGGGGGVKYQSTSYVAPNCKYMVGVFSFDVSCFTTQTLPLMYPHYAGKAHPYIYADTLASHTLCRDNLPWPMLRFLHEII